MNPGRYNFKDLEEAAESLVDFINSVQVKNLIKIKDELRVLCDQHVETNEVVTQIIKAETEIAESVSQRVLDMQEKQQQRARDLESLEEQLRQATAKGQMDDSELQFLKRELESLRNSELKLDTLQKEVDDDTTEIIPSAVYVAQLYYLLTKIKWEYDGPPRIIKGVHYGTDLATPIDIDTSVQSQSNVSDKLWSFVSTEW